MLGMLYSKAQDNTGHGINDTLLTAAVIYNGDTIEAKTLENVSLYSKLSKAQLAALAKYNRLRNAVYVTYPYARRAGMVMNDINMRLALLDPRKSRKEYILSREKELKKNLPIRLPIFRCTRKGVDETHKPGNGKQLLRDH